MDLGSHKNWNYYVSSTSADIITFSNTYLLPYLNYTEFCTGATRSKCLFNGAYKTYTQPDGITPVSVNSVTCFTAGNGAMGGSISCNYIQFSDGSLVALQIRTFGGTGPGTLADGGCIQFTVDLDGPMKGPNKYGRDVFDWIFLYKSLDFGYIEKWPRSDLKLNCNATSGYRCFNLIKYDGWKIADDYPW